MSNPDERETAAPAVGSPFERRVGRLAPERDSNCGLTECAGKPMYRRCLIDCGKQLVPCHWCGTDGDDLFDLWDRFDAGHIAHVHCTHCGANGPSVYSEQSADEAIKQARRLWNWPRPRNKTPND